MYHSESSSCDIMADICSFLESNTSLAAVSQSESSSGESSHALTTCTGSSTSTLESPAKRSRHGESGFDPQWSVDIPWVLLGPEGDGLFCSLCRKHYRRPKKAAVGRASWVDMPCPTVTRQSLTKHGASDAHTDSVKLKMHLQYHNRMGG